ncbi:MAG: hypothetical protein NTX14_03855 [Candidatus Nealsonbacteria bacterium]|nr:hypothetical protein [Candidatus Nealsonbacteria bacterium]
MQERYECKLAFYSTGALLIVLFLFSLSLISLNLATDLIAGLIILILFDCSYLRYRWTKKMASLKPIRR